jgi:hypothetical protein
MDTPDEQVLRQKKITVLAYGEGEDEKIFLRHLVMLYCRRNKVTVSTASAGGGDPMYILNRAIRYRRGVKRDFQFILLDTDKEWSDEMRTRAKEEEIELIGNTPCLEAFFLDILGSSEPYTTWGSGRCKEFFEKLCDSGNFNEEECVKLFPKTLLNEVRGKNSKLDGIIKMIEGFS